LATGGDAPKGLLNDAEAEELLTKLARSGDPNKVVPAIDALNKIRERRRMANEPEADPVAALNAIAEISPEFAKQLAAKEGFPFTLADPEAEAKAEHAKEMIARDWIRGHPKEALRYASFFRELSSAKAPIVSGD
jgi:hypothetical protein